MKARKPWVRVGISPFGIWRPGVPEGIEAGVDSYEHLAADARKWLREGWVDYLMPQLYWRDSPRKQSFSALLGWWREQGKRPVWPGVASSRIKSSEDPGRPASEIIQQVGFEPEDRPQLGGALPLEHEGADGGPGRDQCGAEAPGLSEPALVPPMPWVNRQAPPTPVLRARGEGETVLMSWRGAGAAKWAVQARYGRQWKTIAVLPGKTTSARIGALGGRLAGCGGGEGGGPVRERQGGGGGESGWWGVNRGVRMG